MKRTELPKRSPKQSARMAQAKKLYAERFARFQYCEVDGCQQPASDPHHHTKKRRLGNGLFVFRCICHLHHLYFHENLKAARECGFVDCLSDSDWGKPNGGRP